MNNQAQTYANCVAENIAAGEYGSALDIINDALDVSQDKSGNPKILMTYGGPVELCWKGV